MEFHVVINPAGASGRTKKKMDALQPRMDASPHRVYVHYSSREKGIGALVREITEGACADNPVNLVIAGGDGSLNDAVNGLVNIPYVRLGILPAGSGNDFCLALGISGDLEAELDRILEGRVRRQVGIGEASCYGTGGDDPVVRRFNVSCGIGFDAAICERAERSGLKTLLNRIGLGKLIYLAAAIELIFTFRNCRMKAVMDGERVHEMDNGLFQVAMNTGYEGGGFLFCPDADPGDGRLDVCAVNPRSNWVFFRLFPKAYTGAHVKEKIVRIDRGEKIVFQTDLPQWVHTDGEVRNRAQRVELRLLPEKLSLLQ